MPEKTTLAWLDRLRVWSAAAVVLLHVSGFPFRALKGGPDVAWWWGNVWNSSTRWAVPVYVVISGFLLLGPERREGAIEFWRRRIVRIGIPLVAWGVFYASWGAWLESRPRSVSGVLRSVAIRGDAYYHLWFLYMLLALYLVAPALRAVLRQLGPAGKIALCVTCFAATLRVPGVPRLPWAWLPGWLEFAPPYVGYFVLGGILTREPRARRPLLCGALAVLAGAVTVLGTAWLALRSGSATASRDFQDAASPGVVLLAASVFLLARDLGARLFGPVLDGLARSVLGVYLIHPLVIDLVWAAGLRVERFPAAFGVPLVAALVLAVSFELVRAIEEVPFLRRVV